MELPRGLSERLSALYPGARIVRAEALGADAGGGETEKGLGYGRPIRVCLEAGGRGHDVVLHTARADAYGHDRRADRAAEMLLAFDTFGTIPCHVRALDVGAVGDDGTLVSLRGTGEAWLLTEWAPGTLYAEDLRRIAATGATPADRGRVEALARYLAVLHATPAPAPPLAYARAIRDLVGSGEGIAGIADGYPDDTPGAPRPRLDTIERACLEWRLRLRGRADRLRRVHGDFHPFNILFDGDRLVLLDTSRGSAGDPADDVAALVINFLFFGLEHRERWAEGLGALWRRFFEVYPVDEGLLSALPPFLAWRGLVVASPRWYPHLSAVDRDRILSFVERGLAAPRFELRFGPEAMA